ncbi:SAM-dependent methyltransferase, partial [Streptomyces sp. SID11233]|nr:SAM-dependent methyltransferase [Streptomyces sp. SID11233]
HRRALRRLLYKPGELGLVRGWVSGELEVDGDLYDVLDRLSSLVWDRGEDDTAPKSLLQAVRRPEVRAAGRALLRLAGPG